MVNQAFMDKVEKSMVTLVPAQRSKMDLFKVVIFND